MAALTELQQHITHYWSLPYHQDEALNIKLNEVQAWQRDRLRNTHRQMFEQPKNKPMANYFLNKLYGGAEFGLLAKQLERILPKTKKIEKLAKESALQAGGLAIQASILAIELDMHLAQWLLKEDLPVNDDNMLAAYRAVDEADKRRTQIRNLKEVCYRTDKDLNSFMLRKAFALAKSTAYRRNYQPLYDFIEAGFEAMKPLKSVGTFIDPFCERELALIERVHQPQATDSKSAFGL